MPKTPRKKTVTCRCRSHCTTWNPETRTYEGDGFDIPRSTRDRHRQDDLEALHANHNRQSPVAHSSRSNLPSNSQSRFSRASSSNHQDLQSLGVSPYISQADAIRFITDRLSLLSSWPIIAPGSRFSFVNNPLETGNYELIQLHHTISLFGCIDEWETERLQDQVLEELEKIDWEKEVQWSAQCAVFLYGYHTYNTGMFYNLRNTETPTIRAAMLTTLVLNHVYFNTRRATKVLLAGIRATLQNASVSPTEIARLPLDPRTVSSLFRIHPIVTNFNVCERCNTLYPWEPSEGPRDPEGDVTLYCQYKSTPASQTCGHSLWKPLNPNAQDFRLVPRKKYMHQSLKAWLGRLLSRPDIEDILEQRPFNPPNPPDSPIDDIWLSPYFLELKDPSGSRFYPGTEEEGRLVFGFACDSFDPFYVKTAKQTVSSTAIWLVLLNLPPHLRYLHENLHVVGIIPGPEKPSKDAINPYVDLVVDKLLEFWNPGVFFSRTYRNLHGRAFKAILIPVVCDMLAARQVIGHTSSPTSHDLCTQCDLDKDDIDITDRQQWPEKSVDHVRRCAEAWKNAPDEAERDRLFNAYGIRWSPLLRLPYWDPIKYTVIDSMHTLDLNLFQTHCRKLFTINTTTNGGDGTVTSPVEKRDKRVSSKDDLRSLRRCVQLLENPPEQLEDQLLMMPRKVLYTICVDNNITSGNRTVVAGTKHVLARSIFLWRFSNDYPGSVNTDPLDILPEVAPSDTPEEDIMQADLPKNVIKLIPGLVENERPDEEIYAAGSARAFSLILQALNIPYDNSLNLSGRGAKRVLWDILISRLDADPELCGVLESLIPPPPVNHSRVVLGQDVMECVWHDMTLSQIPTWVATAPRNWGTARRGKLSAAQWRVICTIHLPITLISLWGQEEGRKKDLLDNFMHLVCAVQLANLRVSSPRQADAYDQHMLAYVEGIQHLYPDEKLRPTHHAALHIGDSLRNMGPVHARSTPCFERNINFFHRVNINSHVGQLEGSLLVASACNANVRAMVTDDKNMRSQVLDLVETMEAIESEDIRGFRLASILDPSSSEPTKNCRLGGTPANLTREHSAVLQLYANQQGLNVTDDVRSYLDIARQGVVYGVKGTRTYRNSGVLFSVEGNPANSAPGVIEAILSIPTGNGQRQFVCILRPLQEAPSQNNPYLQFGFAGGGLYLTSQQEVCVVELDRILSHVILTPFDRPPFNGLIHVLPIDRLMKISEADQ
ncbi:hypothetical protein CVT24_007059 [Panaeolus cyanescens]|uniref:Uncharacterized protein n=1 Tax=Panaeolus cyanescens TaxID=181874 RepID=A0A409VJU3_9AGAR|nr:hypothetical protein CVT24_007059 [Panaeolus cyanescens]